MEDYVDTPDGIDCDGDMNMQRNSDNEYGEHDEEVEEKNEDEDEDAKEDEDEAEEEEDQDNGKEPGTIGQGGMVNSLADDVNSIADE
jgi:hypothetical protein